MTHPAIPPNSRLFEEYGEFYSRSRGMIEKQPSSGSGKWRLRIPLSGAEKRFGWRGEEAIVVEEADWAQRPLLAAVAEREWRKALPKGSQELDSLVEAWEKWAEK